jgi:bifunctional DNase/RNase
MIPVTFDKLLFSNMGFVILLKGEDDNRTLPIFIGTVEAQSIALFLSNVQIPRPLTHDLLKSVLEQLECNLKRIEVCDLRDGTFIARLVLNCGGEEIDVDSRPSDAIALALRTSSPIYVDEGVMDEAGRVFTEVETEISGGDDGDEEKKTPLESLKQDLDKAVAEERYEDAVKLRDEIKRLENLHTEN